MLWPKSSSKCGARRSQWAATYCLTTLAITLFAPWRRTPRVHGVPIHLHLVRRHVRGDGAAERLAGAHVELREVERALDDVPIQRAPRERGLPVAAGIQEPVEDAADVRDEDALAIERHPLHRARRQLGRPGHRHEAVPHAADRQTR